MTKENTKYFEEKITEKRRETNPFITKVELDSDILTDEKAIFKQAGAWRDYFQNDNEIFLEIGTGLGNFFSEEVAQNPDTNFIGVELKYKRLFTTAEKCRKKILNYHSTPSVSKLTSPSKRETKKVPPLGGGLRGSHNFILLKTKGENIDKFLGDSEISKTYVFFPDPWGRKERQKKHRLFQEKFIKDLYQKTKSGGKLIFKTDHREYFDTTLELFEKINLWKKEIVSYDYEADNINYDKSKKTEFETIFNEKKVCYVEFKKD